MGGVGGGGGGIKAGGASKNRLFMALEFPLDGNLGFDIFKKRMNIFSNGIKAEAELW